MDQFLTYKKGNLGPVFNFTAFIYIYIYIHTYLHAVKSLSGVSLAFSVVIIWVK